MRCVLIILSLLLYAVCPLSASSTPLRVETALRQVTLRGYSRAIASATISAEVAGRVEKVNYNVGDSITSEPLLSIDPTFIDLELHNNAVALSSNHIVQQQAKIRLDWLQKEFGRRVQHLAQQFFATISASHPGVGIAFGGEFESTSHAYTSLAAV